MAKTEISVEEQPSPIGRRGMPSTFLLFMLVFLSLMVRAAELQQLARDDQERFLLGAKVVRRQTLSVGITSSQRVTLDDGRMTHDAQFQSVDIFKPREETDRGLQVNFRDSYKFNIAAYRLDRLLGLNLVPVSVERNVAGKTGALTWWMNDVLMMEKERYLKKIEPPDSDAWNRQMYQARVFGQLVANTDPNLGNFLITKDWRLWAIDFTRAFRSNKELLDAHEFVCIDPRFHEALKQLSEDAVKHEIGRYLSNWEMEGLLARREKVVEFFDRKAAEQGRDKAFCEVRR
jgi:hypothetical protein